MVAFLDDVAEAVDFSTGERLGAPGIRLQTYPVRVVGDQVVIEVPPAEEPRSIRELLLDHARSWRRDGG